MNHTQNLGEPAIRTLSNPLGGPRRVDTANKHLFARKLHIVNRSRNYIEFTFPGLNRVIHGTINTYEIEIHVIKDNKHMDIIAEFPCFIRHVPNGCIDELLLPEYQFTAPDKETLCRIVSFERFLEWVNEHLFRARWIKIVLMRSGGSSANLVANEIPTFWLASDPHGTIQTIDEGGYVITYEKYDGDERGVTKTIWFLPCWDKST